MSGGPSSRPPAVLHEAAWRALDACAEGVTILDAAGTLLYVNRASAAMSDDTVEDVLGRNIWQLYPDLVATEFHAAITTAAAQDEPVEWTAYYGPNQGWYTDRAQRIGGPGGVVVIVFTRIDEPTQAEQTRQRLTAQVQAALARNELLLGASEELAAAAALDDVPARLGRLVADLGAFSTGLYLIEDGTHLRRARADELDERVRAAYQLVPLDGLLPVAVAARTGRAQFFEDVGDPVTAPHGAELAALRADMSASAARAVAAVPVPGPDGILGALLLVWDTPRALDVSDRALLTTLAGYAGAAVTRIRRAAERLAAVEDRYADTRAAVVTMQRSLLPDLPVLPAVELAAHYAPADAELAAGGDWFDAVALPGGRLALVVGDVVGHGPVAAAAMARLRTLGEHLLHSGTSLPQTLVEVDALAARHPTTRAATVVVALLDADGELTWAAHGHPPPVRLRATGEAEALAAPSGSPLGTGGAPAPVHRARLAPGDTLLLVSDGLLERPGRDTRAGLAALCHRAADLHPARPTLAAFTAGLIAGLGAGGDDDITLLAARMRPVPVAALHVEVPGRPGELPTIRRAVAAWLDALDLSDDDLVTLELTVVEAATNAIEHAYRDREPGPVRVVAQLDGEGGVCLQVADRGRWLAPPADPGPRGRGLQLIRSLTREVEIVPGVHGTTVTARRPLQRGAVVGRPAAEPTVRPDRSRPAYRSQVLRGEPAVLALGGVIDAGVEERLRTDLLHAARGGAVALVVDLDRVLLLASAGVQVLHELAGPLHLRLRAAPGTPARTVLDLAGLAAEPAERPALDHTP